MAVGLTRREQWALIGVVALILAGLGVQEWRGRGGHDEIYVNGQGRWQKIADFEAGQAPPPLRANVRASTKTTLTNAVNGGATRAPAGPDEAGGIDINRATADELDRLPGIGPVRAQAILETRRRLGGFREIDQLTEVSGIGPKRLAKLRPYVRLSESAPTSRSVEEKSAPLAPPRLDPLPAPVTQKSPLH